MKWDWIFFDADETLFTFDSFGGLQRMFLDYSVTFTAEDFKDYPAPSPHYNYSISAFRDGRSACALRLAI